MSEVTELFQIADKLQERANILEKKELKDKLRRLTDQIAEIKICASGSWLGYQAYVYYENLQTPPPGAHFTSEWGLEDFAGIGLGSTGRWLEYDPKQIRAEVFRRAGNPDLTEIREISDVTENIFKINQHSLLEIFHTIEFSDNALISKLKADLEKNKYLEKSDIIDIWRPKRFQSRDAVAVSQGIRAPPHVDLLAELTAISSRFQACAAAADIARKAASFLERQMKKKIASNRVGTNVFIGHGRSQAWRELKDFIQDRLHLPCDEFNRIPVAGLTNIARLSEMLESAAIAFIIMTGEDESLDGSIHARLNVIHEVGLFQGRLGFTKAIILLEDGCSEFSNVQGLGQIRFPKNQISYSFEEIRKVIEREELIR